MEHLYIVLWRVTAQNKWNVESIVYSASDRDVIVAATKIKNPDFEVAWIEGPICSQEAEAMAEARLGAF